MSALLAKVAEDAGVSGGLTKILVGLGWDVNRYDGGAQFDLDAAAFCLTDSGKVSGQNDFIFYGNLTHPSGGIQHLGDNLTGDGTGDGLSEKYGWQRRPQSGALPGVRADPGGGDGAGNRHVGRA